jgi:uncharacterized membrane protein YkvA (DUF1232 family)
MAHDLSACHLRSLNTGPETPRIILWQSPSIQMLRLLRLWRLARHDLRLLWFALRHQRRPLWLWPVAIVLALYALDPFNFAIPLLGVLDDLILLPLILHLVATLLPAEIRAGFDRRLPLTPSR